MAMSRIKGKRGVFYTFIAIGLVSILVYSFVIHTGYIYRNSITVTEIRIETIANFMKDVEGDVQRGLFISGFRSILAIQNHISENKSFADDIEGLFTEAMINSTIKGQSSPLLQDASFTDWMVKMEQEAEKLDIILEFSPSNMSIEHVNPWTIQVGIDYSMNVSDDKGTAGWKRDGRVNAYIDIIGLEDPTYSLNTYGKVMNMVRKGNSTDFNDIDVLKNHLMHSYYVESDRGPSFLMRLSGNMSPSPYGIESIVNIEKLIINDVPVEIKSNVDYAYFSNVSVPGCQINQTYDAIGFEWFRLDDSDSYYLSRYMVDCI